MKRFILFFLTMTILICLGVGFFKLHPDIFFAAIWFLIFISIVTPITSRISSIFSQLSIYIAILVLGFLWYIFNDILLHLISENINSNPYGEYVLSQFEFRLSLSIFVLKIIKNSWLTDTRLFICTGLLTLQIFIYQRLRKFVCNRLPTRLFEFIITVFSHVSTDISRYLASSLVLALVDGAMWCLAGFLLQFDNFILMTFIMVICAFIPHIGLLIAGCLSLTFIESGLFLIQLGGLLIAMASIWFINHTIFRDRQQLAKPVSIFILMLVPPAGYALFRLLSVFITMPHDTAFWGFFLAAPLTFVSALTAKTIREYSDLIHKKSLQSRKS